MSQSITARPEAESNQWHPIATRLPWFDAAAIAWRQRLIGTAGQQHPQNGHRLVWCVPPANRFLGYLDCTGPAGSFLIGLNDWSRLVPGFPDGIDHLPEQVRLEISAAGVGPVLDRMAQFLGGPLRVVARHESHATLIESLENDRVATPSGPLSLVHLGFQMFDAAESLLASGEFFSVSLHSVAREPALASGFVPDKVANLVVSLPIELGRRTLRARDVAAIEGGDVIRLDMPVDLSMPVSVFVPLYRDRPGGLQCRIAGKTLIVESIVNTTTEADATEEPLAETESDEEVSIDPADIECTVVAELGRLQMTVQQLSTIQAGQALTLPGRAAAVAVSLKVQGRQIGRGELIAVGDELAVMVTELGPSGSSTSEHG